MIYNFLFLSAFSLFLVQGNGFDINDSLLELEQMIRAASKEVSSIADSINNVHYRHNEMVEEKLPCLTYQYQKLTNALNTTIIETTLKALSKDKQFPCFQCISSAGSAYLKSMTATFSKMSEQSDRIKEKGAEPVLSYGSLIPGFYKFLNDLYSESASALAKSETEDDLRKVLGEASKRIRNLNAVLDQIDKKLEELAFAFFNEYVSFVHAVDESFRKSSNDGKTKVTACLRK